MSKRIYKEKYKTNVYDVDTFGRPRLSRLTEHLLTSATEHCELLGWGYDKLTENGAALVIVKAHIKLLGEYRLNQEIEITTWPSARIYPISTRYYVAVDTKTGKTAYEGAVEVVLIDAETRSIVNSEKYRLSTLTEEELKDDTGLPEITSGCARFNRRERTERLGQKPLTECEIIAKYSDLDYNGHVNSARYVTFIEDALGKEFFEKNSVTEMDVQYNEEVLPGSAVCVRVYRDGDIIYCYGLSGETVKFEVILKCN